MVRDRSAARNSDRGAVTPEAVRLHLQKVLTSPEMATATRLQQFLTFVVEKKLGGAESIKETELAIGVFNRRPSFDPIGDSVVRVAASNLRHRLRDYYARSGSQDALIIDVPKGSYVPVFQVRQTGPSPGRTRPWTAALLVVLCLVAGGGYWAYSARQTPKATSIAVLPFLNLSGTAEIGSLGDGLVEEVSTALAQADGLKVVSRSSAFQFRAKGFDVREAGRQLNVETVLEGSVRTTGKGVRINAQLIQVSDGFHLWSHAWEGDIGELYAMQEELAQSVASVLRYRLRGHAAAPRNPEAYVRYLKAQSYHDQSTVADLSLSGVLLREAIATDATWAPAHAALADTYASIAYMQAQPSPDLIARAKQAAETALRLDGRLAEAHAVLAWVKFFYDWDWAGSEKGLRQALEFNPNSSRTLDWLAQRLMSEGRFDEALTVSGKALALDPLSYRASANVAVVLYCARRFEEAIAQSRLVLQMNPRSHKAHIIAGVSLQELGRWPEAEKALRAALELLPGDPDAESHLGAVVLARGRREEAMRILDRLEHPPKGEIIAAYSLACLNLTLGRQEQAIRALETAVAQRSSDIVVMNVDPALAALHGDKRFRALTSKLGLRH
ncbi:MAG TPA: CDC27 family protein [Bryobacteraceae bacterium]|nr:CDC27 family protein [Bryobacteraceae bacterium]